MSENETPGQLAPTYKPTARERSTMEAHFDRRLDEVQRAMVAARIATLKQGGTGDQIKAQICALKNRMRPRQNF
jgi:hypothetical protein